MSSDTQMLITKLLNNFQIVLTDKVCSTKMMMNTYDVESSLLTSIY